MVAVAVNPAELVGDCLTGGVRRLIGGAHSLTSSRAVVVCVDQRWVWVKFSTDPGRLIAPWEVLEDGWRRAPRGSEPGLRDASADPVLVVVGVGESSVLAVNALAIDEIGVTCGARAELVAHWISQAAVQGATADESAVAGARVSENPDATVVVADVLGVGEPGWVDVLAAGTAWPVSALRWPGPTATAEASDLADAGADVGTLAHDSTDGIGAAESGSAATAMAGAEHQDSASSPTTNQTLASEAAESPGRRGGVPWMTVFGDFDVTDAGGDALPPLQQNLVGAIAFNQPIATCDLSEMVYGQSRRPKSFHVAMTKIRQRGLQPTHSPQGYRIDIDSQWSRFSELAGPDPEQAPTGSLAAAAAMITTPLFGDTPPAWVSAQLPAMRSLICQVCRELAARHAGEPAQALTYAQLGLAVDADHAELRDIVALLTSTSSHDSDPDRGITA